MAQPGLIYMTVYSSSGYSDSMIITDRQVYALESVEVHVGLPAGLAQHGYIGAAHVHHACHAAVVASLSEQNSVDPERYV